MLLSSIPAILFGGHKSRISDAQPITEERNKPYFSHWSKPGGKRSDGSKSQITPENKVKTTELLGASARCHSDVNNVSSCWNVTFVRKGWRP